MEVCAFDVLWLTCSRIIWCFVCDEVTNVTAFIGILVGPTPKKYMLAQKNG